MGEELLLLDSHKKFFIVYTLVEGNRVKVERLAASRVFL